MTAPAPYTVQAHRPGVRIASVIVTCLHEDEAARVRDALQVHLPGYGVTVTKAADEEAKAA